MTSPLRVFLTGATGFIGGHVLSALVERGHAVTCLARGEGARRLEAMALPGVRVVRGEFVRPETWLRELPGHDVVVNTVGIIRERPGSSFAVVHTQAPIALFDAAARAGVRKIVQLSALGADAGAAGPYVSSKGAADASLARLGVPYVVIRPSLVYGPGDQSMSYFLSLAALPLTPVPGNGQYRVQPIHVDDLARAHALAVERDDLSDLTVDVGGAEDLTFDALLDTLAHWIGKTHGTRKVHLPWGLIRLVASVTDAAGGRGPITSEELELLRRGSCADNTPFVERFGFEPVPLAVGLARRPRSEDSVWHARLAHLRVPLRLSIAFVWLATGIISAFVYPESASRDLLARVGITGAAAPLVLYGTSFFEIALGLATAIGFRIRLLAAIQLALIAAFTLIITFGLPEFWLHPFGPLTKNISLFVATLVMMALEE